MGAESCLATTDANGVASCNPQPIINDVPGTYSASGTFAATNTYAGSATGPVTYKVNQAPTSTTLTYTGPIAVDYDNHLTLTANLGESDNPGTGVSGREVDFTITDGGTNTQTCNGGTTDSSGNVACTIQNVTLLPLQPYTVTASFAGDTYYLPSSSTPAAFTVNKAPTTFTYSGATVGNYHATVSLSGKLIESDTGFPVSARSVTFSVTPGPAGTQTCTTTTLADGTASCTVVLKADPGSSFNAGGSFGDASDQYYVTSSTAPQAFTINKEPTVLTYTGDLSQDWNDPTSLSANLTEFDTSAPIQGESVTFTVSNGTSSQSCAGTTDVNGKASCSFVVSLTPGSGYTVTASFAGDIDYLSTSVSQPYTVTREESVVVYTGATTGDYSDHVTLRGVLTADTVGGTPLSGRQLTFTLGSKSCSATTSSSGVASCSVMIGDVAGSYQVVAGFAGDTYYAPTTGSANFTITPEEDNLSYTGPTAGKKGSQVTLSAKLSSDDGAIAGRPITFTIGSQSCAGTTNSSGVASCSLTLTQNVGIELHREGELRRRRLLRTGVKLEIVRHQVVAAGAPPRRPRSPPLHRSRRRSRQPGQARDRRPSGRRLRAARPSTR